MTFSLVSVLFIKCMYTVQSVTYLVTKKLPTIKKIVQYVMRRRESLYIKGNGPPNIIQILGDKK